MDAPRILFARRRRVGVRAGLAILTLLLAACGSTRSSAGPSPAAGEATTTAAPVSTPAGVDMRTLRYCEVLLVQPTNGDLVADVYNTYPLNDCPADQWAALDPAAIAAQEGVPTAVLNGPRYWLMDSVEKSSADDRRQKEFGGMAMLREATVNVGPLARAATPYVTHEVDRSTVFTFEAGRSVYELVGPDGTVFVMQSWSQQVEPGLTEADLAGLGPRLHLPAGWSYRTRVLDAPLRVVTTTTAAKVLQDDLKNSYSQETTG